MANFRIAVIGGDGIGPEVIDQAIVVQPSAALKRGRGRRWNGTACRGARAYYKQNGAHAARPTAGTCSRRHDAILFGAIGDPDVPDIVTGPRTAAADAAEVRPVRQPPAGVPVRRRALPLARQEARVDRHAGLPREHRGRIRPGRRQALPRHAEEVAVQTAVFTRRGCERILRAAFEAAQKRPRKKLTTITKSNALVHGMGLWDDAFEAVRKEYPDVQANSLLVDAAAMDFVRKPEAFDVVVASNLFGDILTDLSAA